MRLTGKVALISGAASGMGRSEATIFAAEGARVVVGDLLEAEGRDVVDTIAKAGGQARFVKLDVTDEKSWQDAVASAVSAYGKLDILVNNAGISGTFDPDTLSVSAWDRLMSVNAKGVFFCLQRVAREMIARRRGVIVNIASIAGKGYAGTSNAIYAASKGAVISMTRIAALQLARHNINVNAICPGVTVTALSKDNLVTRARDEGVSVEEMERRRNSVIPIGRANDPEDIAALAVFLASPGARNITGQSFNVDGGLILD